MGIIVDMWHRLALSASLVSDVIKKPFTFVLDMKDSINTGQGIQNLRNLVFIG